MRTPRWLFTALASIALLAACGEDGGQTVTVVERTVTQQAPPVEEDPAEPSEDPAAAAEGVGESAESGRIRVPAVEGKDHQLAQDTLQAAGLYNISEEDATGQGRLLILDRNWTVVEQDPPAGTPVNEDATITLRSKKDGE